MQYLSVTQRLAWAFLKGPISCKWKRESHKRKAEALGLPHSVPSWDSILYSPQTSGHVPCFLGAQNTSSPAAVHAPRTWQTFLWK